MKKTAVATQSGLAVRSLTEGAILLAIAQVLSFITLYKMPWGGSVDLAMFPILLYSVRWGLKEGIGMSFVYGVLQFITAGGIAIGWESIIGDYVVAYTVLGFAGLFQGKKLGVYLGTAVGCTARFLVHYVVGATIWSAYMPDAFFGMTMTTPWVYSFLYNIAYMLPSTLLCIVIFLFLTPSMGKYLTGEDLQGG